MPAEQQKTSAPAGRAGRPVLSRERIVREALALVDEGGVESLTMRRLGERLGVEAMSLYGHVDGKADLLDGIVALLWEEVEQATEKPDSGDWRRTLGGLAARLRELAGEHPGAYSLLAGSTSLNEPMLRAFRVALDELRAAGFDRERAAKSLNAVVGYACGYGVMEIACQGVGDCGVELEDVVEMVNALPPGLPADLVRVVQDTYGPGFDEQFEFGLEAVLAGLERRA